MELNRLSILLELLSFFLAAPEILTEIRQDDGRWLEVLEQYIERDLTGTVQLVTMMLALGFLTYLLGMTLFVILESSRLVADSKVPQSIWLESEWLSFGLGLTLGFVWLSFMVPEYQPESIENKAVIAALLVLPPILGLLLAVRAWQEETWTWLGVAVLAEILWVLQIWMIIRSSWSATTWSVMAIAVTVVIIVLMSALIKDADYGFFASLLGLV